MAIKSIHLHPSSPRKFFFIIIFFFFLLTSSSFAGHPLSLDADIEKSPEQISLKTPALSSKVYNTPYNNSQIEIKKIYCVSCKKYFCFPAKVITIKGNYIFTDIDIKRLAKPGKIIDSYSNYNIKRITTLKIKGNIAYAYAETENENGGNSVSIANTNTDTKILTGKTSNFHKGLWVFDISKLPKITHIKFWNTTDISQDFEIYGDYIFSYFFSPGYKDDPSQLRITRFDIKNPYDIFLDSTYHTYGIRSLRLINGNYLYLIDINSWIDNSDPFSSSLIIIDIADSNNIKQIASYRIKDFIIGLAPYNLIYPFVSDKYFYIPFAYNSDFNPGKSGLAIFDISNPLNLQLIKEYILEEILGINEVLSYDKLFIRNDYAYLISKNSKLIILDLKNPSEIYITDSHDLLDIDGNFSFLSNDKYNKYVFILNEIKKGIKNEFKLYVFDISEPSNIKLMNDFYFSWPLKVKPSSVAIRYMLSDFIDNYLIVEGGSHSIINDPLGTVFEIFKLTGLQVGS